MTSKTNLLKVIIRWLSFRMEEFKMLSAVNLKMLSDIEEIKTTVVEETSRTLFQKYGKGILNSTRKYLQNLAETNYPVYYLDSLEGSNCECEHSSMICYKNGEVMKFKLQGRSFGKTLREYGNLEILSYNLKHYGFVKSPSPTLVYKREETSEEFDGIGMTNLGGVLINSALSMKKTRKDAAKKLGMMMGVFDREQIIHSDLRPDHVYYDNGQIGVIDVEGMVIGNADRNVNSSFDAKTIDKLIEEERKKAFGFIPACYAHAPEIGRELEAELGEGFRLTKT